MLNFDDAFIRLMENEGGYSNRSAADDPGLETKFGITKAVARAWGYLGEMKELPLSTAKDIAKANYWTPQRCDQLPPAIAFHVFDSAYHGGYPARWLQAAANVNQDGIIGPKTIEAIRAANPAELILKFNQKRLEYLTKLQNWPSNSRGWTMRIVRNMEIF